MLSPTSSSPSASLNFFSERGRLHPSPSPPHSVDVGPFCLFLPGRERPLGDLESYAPDLVRGDNSVARVPDLSLPSPLLLGDNLPPVGVAALVEVYLLSLGTRSTRFLESEPSSGADLL